MGNNAGSKKLVEEINRYYDARAPWHDQYMRYESIEGMEALLSPIIDTLAEMISDKSVLEVACGTGNWTQILAKRACSVTAVDISPNALEIARRKLSLCSNVSLIQGDAYDLQNVGGTFDVVFAADWWSHIPNGLLSVFLDSATKKLRPDSRAIFIDMSFREGFARETCRYDADNNRISLRRLPDGSEFEVVKNFPSESELRRILADYAGNIVYYEFDSLKRWMIVFENR